MEGCHVSFIHVFFFSFPSLFHQVGVISQPSSSAQMSLRIARRLVAHNPPLFPNFLLSQLSEPMTATQMKVSEEKKNTSHQEDMLSKERRWNCIHGWYMGPICHGQGITKCSLNSLLIFFGHRISPEPGRWTGPICILAESLLSFSKVGENAFSGLLSPSQCLQLPIYETSDTHLVFKTRKGKTAIEHSLSWKAPL